MSSLKENTLLGIGNPLLDISANVEENLLKVYDLKEDEAILAAPKHQPLYSHLVDKYDVEYIAGGSTQNTLRVIQWLIGKPNVVTLFGCIGNDDFGTILNKQATKDGVNAKYQYTDKEPTGTCAVLITNHHRTLCANLAAANCFTLDHIRDPENRKLIETADYIYSSGFFLTVSPASLMEIAKHAHESNKPFIMNLAAEFLCTIFKGVFMDVMPYVDLLFGNEAEARAFAEGQNINTKDIKEIALELCKLPKINKTKQRVLVITRGTEPVILAKDGAIEEFPVVRLSKELIVDTNGAGDAFAGGFLSQYIQGKSFPTCIKCGIWAASQIIQRSGCTFDGKASFSDS